MENKFFLFYVFILPVYLQVSAPLIIEAIRVAVTGAAVGPLFSLQAGSLKMNTALEYSTRVVQEGGRRCKKS